MQDDERLMLHVSQEESETDWHIRLDYEQTRELLDALSELAAKSELPQGAALVRMFLRERLDGVPLPDKA